MDLREIRYIIEIANTGHITTAANNLFISQPALSKTLHKAEGELKTKLFYKDNNRLCPTDACEVLLIRGRKIIELYDEMVELIDDLQNLKKGRIRFGVPSILATLFLPECIIRFNEQYPGISLHMTEAGGAALTQLTDSGKVDISMVMRPIYNNNLNEVPIFRDEVVACVNSSHPWASKKYVTIEDLLDIPIVTFNSTFNVYTELMKRYKSEGIQPKIKWLGSDCDFLYKFAHMSGSVLILPKPMIKEYCGEDNVSLIPFQPKFEWEISCIFCKNKPLSQASKALLLWIQEYFMYTYDTGYEYASPFQ